MGRPADDPIPFFDEFPRFLETSRTGRSLDRLNARYTGLIHRQRHLLEGAAVLDLASHDGRFSFAALHTGAARVVGVEVDTALVAQANENMRAYGVSTDRYQFVARDMFRHFDDLDRFDVVLCFGVFYHINDHMQLLSNIEGVEPHWVFLDTRVSRLSGSVIELRSPLGASPPPLGSHLEGYPTPLAVDVMMASFGWQAQPLDWHGSGLLDGGGMDDYRLGERVSVIARGNPRVPRETRDYAVGLVQALQQDRGTQWMTIKGVAEKCGVSPYALKSWVTRAEGDPRLVHPGHRGPEPH